MAADARGKGPPGNHPDNATRAAQALPKTK
jgi:hypothetical protein